MSAVVKMSRPGAIALVACNVFIAVADITDCMSTVACGNVPPDVPREAVEIFLPAYATAFGIENLTPKCHWLLHYIGELARHGILYSCFVHERKHKTIRRYATAVENTRTFEHTTLTDTTCHHMYSLKSKPFNFEVGLVNSVQMVSKK